MASVPGPSALFNLLHRYSTLEWQEVRRADPEPVVARNDRDVSVQPLGLWQ